MKRILSFLLVPAMGLAVGFLPDRRISAPASRPLTALARINAHGGVGCGVLVGPDLLLTCSHCVASGDRKLYEDVDIEMGLGFYSVTHHAKVLEYFKMTGRGGNYDAGDDWAIVRLDRPLGAYYGWLECRTLPEKEWSTASPELLGYCDCPGERRPEMGRMDKPYLCQGTVSHVGPKILFHNCASWGGTSGAPLLVKNGKGSYWIAGLNFAGVDVQGEKLENGFRAKYSKELANLAIPCSSWQPQLAEIKSPKLGPPRTLWVRNRSTRPLKVVARYHSLFQEPGEQALQTEEIEVGWHNRALVLKPEDGCLDSEVFLCVTDAKGNPVGPKPTFEIEQNGKAFRFFKKSLGESAEYTTLLP